MIWLRGRLRLYRSKKTDDLFVAECPNPAREFAPAYRTTVSSQPDMGEVDFSTMVESARGRAGFTWRDTE